MLGGLVACLRGTVSKMNLYVNAPFP